MAFSRQMPHEVDRSYRTALKPLASRSDPHHQYRSAAGRIPPGRYDETSQLFHLVKSTTTPFRDESYGLFRVTHPFHPLNGQQFELITRKHTWGDDRVFYHDKEGRLRSINASWTSVVTPDPFVVISTGRSMFRVEDLLALVVMIGKHKE